VDRASVVPGPQPPFVVCSILQRGFA
jgi:hypothetical protein